MSNTTIQQANYTYQLVSTGIKLVRLVLSMQDCGDDTKKKAYLDEAVQEAYRWHNIFFEIYVDSIKGELT